MTRPTPVAITARIAAIRIAVPGARYHLPSPLDWQLSIDGEARPSRQGITDRAVLLIDGLAPATRYRLEVEGQAAVDFTTLACAGLVDAAQFGLAEGTPIDCLDVAIDNALALARSVEAVPLGGTLRLGAGCWTAMPLRLRSDLTLHLDDGAELRAPSVRQGWPILPAHDETGRMLGSWEGLPAACFAAPVFAFGARNLTIEGPGVLDGSGAEGDWWQWPKETRDGARRPRGLHLIDCSNVNLLGFTIRNAPSWTIHPQGCTGLTAAGLSIEAPHDSPNTDGFDPDGCHDVTIEGLRFTVGDDCIAIKAGKRGADGDATHLRDTRNVTVRHCLMERGHGGVVIGSEMSGGVHDVTVEDCEMVGTDRGLRLKTRRGRGGAITGIAMRRVRMDGVLTALSANAHYHCDADGHDDWVQSRDPALVDVSTPAIDGITVEDVDIHGLAHAAGAFLGLAEQPIRNVSIKRLRIHSCDQQAQAASPVMADRVRAIRHEMILSEHAEISCDDPELLSSAGISLPTATTVSL